VHALSWLSNLLRFPELLAAVDKLFVTKDILVGRPSLDVELAVGGGGGRGCWCASINCQIHSCWTAEITCSGGSGAGECDSTEQSPTGSKQWTACYSANCVHALINSNY